MGCLNVNELHIVEGLEIPDWLLIDLMTERNLGTITSAKINEWACDYVLGMARQCIGNDDLRLYTSHVHIGDIGIEPHDHLPYLFTSVIFLTDSLGELVMVLPSGEEKVIRPEEGKMVLFPASWIHYVNPSPEPELRVTFVSNYEHQTV